MRGYGAVLLWTTTLGRTIFVEAMPANAHGGVPTPRDPFDDLHSEDETKVVSFTEGLMSLISPVWATHDVQSSENDDEIKNNNNSNQDDSIEVLGHGDLLEAHDTRSVASAEEWKELGVTELLSASSLFSPAVSAANFVLEQRQSSDGGEPNAGTGDGDDIEELYLCSNPNFDTTCGEGCACASVPVTPEIMGYGGKPPCGMCSDYSEAVSTIRGHTRENIVRCCGYLNSAELTDIAAHSCSPVHSPAREPTRGVVCQGIFQMELHTLCVSQNPILRSIIFASSARYQITGRMEEDGLMRSDYNQWPVL